jgi:membrane-anchored mycosin MYCP
VPRFAVLTVVLILALLSAPPAVAVSPPAINPDALPPDVTGPDQPLEQRRECAAPTTLPDSDFQDPPWPNTYLDIPGAQQFATGAGVIVAVIDTGAMPSPRLPIEPGGDFVDPAGDGLSDCDAHGTLTASIIAGRPATLVAPPPLADPPPADPPPAELPADDGDVPADADVAPPDSGDASADNPDEAAPPDEAPPPPDQAPTPYNDGYVGVAPDARVISLRQTSEAFEPVGLQASANDPNSSPAAGSIRSLARAVVHAANLGANVINISEAACFKVTRTVDESTLGAALNYAVNVKGAVVIVAAGNTGGDCAQNPPPDPSQPQDPRGWDQVQTIVTPAWYAPMVLTVGGVGPDGASSPFSMHGPWVGIAAPAQDIVALGGDGQPVNALQGNDGPIPIAGTSFAAAYVSGLAALLRQRFPDLTPAQIINRITASARHPGGGVDDTVGAGVINPVAALTWDIPAGPVAAPVTIKRLPPPVPVLPPDRGPITAVALGAGGLLLAFALAALGGRALRRR